MARQQKAEAAGVRAEAAMVEHATRQVLELEMAAAAVAAAEVGRREAAGRAALLEARAAELEA